MKLKEALKGKLNAKDLQAVPSSFDVVGSIAIFNEFPPISIRKEKAVAETLMQLNPAIKTVARKTAKFSGRLRLQKIKIIAGEKTKETMHVENGVRLLLDVEKCYFSPRLANERLRIARQVKKDEKVLVLFSGVGPYTCVIARLANAKEVIGIEINRVAHKYAEENIKMNKLGNAHTMQGDVKKILPKLKGKFDRIIMPLPKTAELYLPHVMKKLNPRGVIHSYIFATEEQFPEIVQKYKKQFRKVTLVKAGVYAPYVYRVCLDLQH